MSQVLDEFKAAMKAKYGPLANSNGTPMKSTGFGPDNILQTQEPAGVVHEGEGVLEAPLINDLGGPQAARQKIEELRGMEKKLPGFRSGTGGGVVPSREELVFNETKPGVIKQEALTPPSPVSFNETKPGVIKQETFGPPSPASFNETKPGVIKQETLTPPPPASFNETKPGVIKQETFGPPTTPIAPPSDLAKMSAKSLSGMQDIAAGESDAARLAREKATSSLAGEQAAGRLVGRQQAAQTGVSDEVAAAGEARLGREERLAKTSLETALAQGDAERAEAAQMKLASLTTGGALQERALTESERRARAMEAVDWAKLNLSSEELADRKDMFNEELKLSWAGQGIDERQMGFMEEKWGDQMDTWYAEFSEDAGRWGAEFALNKMKTNTTMSMAIADSLMAAGDIEGATKVFSDNLNLNVDFSAVKDATDQKAIGDAFANVLAHFEINPGATASDPVVSGQLERAWEAMGKTAGTDEYKLWASESVQAMKLTKDPYYSAISGISDLTFEGLILDNNANVDDFAFAGKTGIPAAKMAMTNFLLTGGMQLTTNGLTMNPDSAAAELLFGGKEEDEAGAEPALLKDLRERREEELKYLLGEKPGPLA